MLCLQVTAKIKEIYFKILYIASNNKMKKVLISINLVVLQLFNLLMRSLSTKLISLTSCSSRKVKGNPVIGGIVLFCRILMAYVATSP